MGGVGVFAWIAIGVVGGWTVSRLMVGADDDALRGTAAGMIGAVLAALGLRLLDPAPALGNVAVNTSMAALGGSLWLAWLTCVLTSGRRGDEVRRPEVALTRHGDLGAAEPQRPVLAYARTVAADLQGDRRATDVPVVTRLDGAGHRPSADRVQVVTEWLRGK